MVDRVTLDTTPEHGFQLTLNQWVSGSTPGRVTNF